MMDKKQFRLFSWLWLFSALIWSWAPPQAFSNELGAELSVSKTIDGSIVLVTVKVPADSQAEAPAGEFEEIQLPFYPLESDGHSMRIFQAVLGVPFNHKPGLSKVTVSYSGKKVELPLMIQDGKYPSEKLRVKKRLVTPRKADLARIKREQAEIGKVYRQVTREKLWSGPFSMPIDSPVTSIFGTKRVYNGQLNGFHGGIDLRAAIGTPIFAPAAGVVVLARNLFFTGNTVFLDHGYGIITLYAHLSKLQVKEGQRVAAREPLGLSGNTGRVNGPHLHWQAIVHRTKVNPLDLTQVLR